jgi:hypothetical protein
MGAKMYAALLSQKSDVMAHSLAKWTAFSFWQQTRSYHTCKDGIKLKNE